MAHSWSWRGADWWQWVGNCEKWNSAPWSASRIRSRSPCTSSKHEDSGWHEREQTQISKMRKTAEEVPVLARLLSGRVLSTVLLTPCSFVSDLRRPLMEALRADSQAIATPCFDLVFNGRILQDRELVKSVGLMSGAEVTVLLASPFKVLVAYEDRSARMFDGITGACERFFRGHRNALKSANFSCDGKRVVTASDDFTIKVFAAGTGQCTDTIKQHRNNVNMASFSPDGVHILSASDDGTARLISESLPMIYKGHRNVVSSAVFSFDGSLVLTASDDKTAKIFHARTGQCIQTFVGHVGPVQSATFSPNASLVLTASHDGTACIFDAKTGAQKLQLKHDAEVRAASFSSDGTKLVTVAAGVKVFDAETGACERILIRNDSSEDEIEGLFDCHLVNSAVFSHDGDKVLTASDNGVVRLFTLATGECQRTYEPTPSGGRARCGAFSAVFAPTGT